MGWRRPIAIRSRFFAACLSVGLLGAVAVPNVAERGERSYSLPEIDEAPVVPARVVSAAVWDRDADVPPFDRDILAIGAGSVAFVRHGVLCGYAELNGAQTWCVRGGSGPAYAAGQVAFTTADGGIVSVDAIDGSVRWRYRFSASAKHVAGGVNAESAWSTGSDFLVVRGVDDAIAEVSAAGTTRWSAHVGASGNPRIEQAYAFFSSVEDGAIISTGQHVVRLGPNGGFGDIAFESPQIAAVDPPYAFVTLDTNEEVEDHFLTLDIGRVDLRTGDTDARYHFEPDYAANSAAYDTATGGFAWLSEAPVRFDGALLYATVIHTLYRYRFADPSGQRPLLVAHDADLIGGPYRGAMFVRRHDGVWSLQPGSDAIRARMLARSTAGVSDFVFAGSSAFIAFNDGSVRGVDAATGQTLLDAKPCAAHARMHIAASRTRVFVACSAPNRWRIVAFPRPDSRGDAVR